MPATFDCNTSDSPESGGPQPPPAEGRTASLVGSLYPKRSLRPEKIPATAGRSGQPPPPAGSDTRQCSCLRAGRLTRCRWALQPISLLGTTSAGVGRWVKTANKRRNASDSKSRRPVALPLRRGRTASLAGSLYPKRAGCEPKTSSEAVARGNFISLCSRKDERNSSLCGRATGRQ